MFIIPVRVRTCSELKNKKSSEIKASNQVSPSRGDTMAEPFAHFLQWNKIKNNNYNNIIGGHYVRFVVQIYVSLLCRNVCFPPPYMSAQHSQKYYKKDNIDLRQRKMA